MVDKFKYAGQELELFSKAKNWKSYWASRVSGYIGQSILEVGSGIGSNTKLFEHFNFKKWVCLEPDPYLADQLTSSISKNLSGDRYIAVNGFIHSLPKDCSFDTILYIDVLEHIRSAKDELDHAGRYLSKGGHIIIILPAHSWLFSDFDRAIGHYQRYNINMLKKIVPRNMTLLKTEYLDSMGVMASIFNRFFLKQDIPSKNQIKHWDSIIVPCSRFFDRLIHFSLGKSLLGILQYNN